LPCYRPASTGAVFLFAVYAGGSICLGGMLKSVLRKRI